MKKVYSAIELQRLYDNQKGLSDLERRVLNVAMWLRARHSNYHGYAKQWYNVTVENGVILEDPNK